MSEYFCTRYSFDDGRSRVWRAIAEDLQGFVSPASDCVLDLGAGYCDFINAIRANRKFAIDLDPDAAKYCGDDVVFHCGSVTDLPFLGSGEVDVVFASNLLEHLTDGELDAVASELNRVLKASGRLIVIQPNFRYAYREYFDDYTHKKIFTHVSLGDYFLSRGFRLLRMAPRYLPFSMKSRLPKSYLLTRIYLRLPFRPFAKQMLGVFVKC